MKSVLIVVAWSLLLNVAWSQQVKKGAPPSWIHSISYDEAASPPPGQEAGYYYLLVDEQENVATQEMFSHYAYRVLTSEGLQQMSDLSINFDPSYETITFHSLTIRRGGKMLDQLPARIRTAQREQNMDRYLYDESLTALINLKDVRIGDLIEYSFTRKGYNPVFERHFNRRVSVNYAFPYAKGHHRYLVPKEFTLSFKYHNTDNKPTTTIEGALTTYIWQFENVQALTPDKDEPDWYNGYSYIQMTSMKSWAQVAQWALTHYQIPKQDNKWMNELLREFPEDQEKYAQHVIHLVQNDIRYLGFESGLNSHKPHPPKQIYEQRFGDCKDKSLLLVALLRARGIEAYPMLVNTYMQQRLVDILPSINAFDHCVVKLRWQDHDIFVDPTINSQGGSLKNKSFPYYAYGLVIAEGNQGLTKLPRPSNSGIHEVHRLTLVKVGGEAQMKVKTTYRGADAESQRSYFASNSISEIQKAYLNYYGNLYSDIAEADPIEFKDDLEANTFTIEEHYTIPNIWKPVLEVEGKLQCEIYPLTLEGYFKVSKSEQRNAPYRLPYPVNHRCEIHVELPEAWDIEEDEKHITTDYYSYDYFVKRRGNAFTISTHYVTKDSYVPIAGFKQFVKDHETMMGNLGYYLTHDPNAQAAVGGPLAGTLVTVFITLMAAALVIWLYRGYDPAPEYLQQKAEPIGGWLILVAIGITLSPVRLIYEFVKDPTLLGAESWMSLWVMEKFGTALFILCTQVYNILSLLFSALLVVLFYMRRSSLPLLASIMYAVTAVMTIADSFVANQISADVPSNSRDIIRSLVAAAIWIPYLLRSERVKKTFVNRYRPTNEATSQQGEQTIYTMSRD